MSSAQEEAAEMGTPRQSRGQERLQGGSSVDGSVGGNWRDGAGGGHAGVERMR